MPVTAIDHVLLAMPPHREDEARRFYCDLLGIPEIPKPPELAKRGGCWFERGPLKVHLGVEEDFRPARKAHTAFIVEGLSALSTKLADAGFRFKRDDALDNHDRIFVDDPFGNRIELIERRVPA